jgi:hypothetical protein
VSNASELGALLYELESSWAEEVETFATQRIPNNGLIDVSGLKHDKIDPKALVQTLQGGVQWIPGPQSGSLVTTTYLTGLGSAPGAGAITVDALATWLKTVFGNATLTAASGDTATGGTATVPTTTSSATFAAGGLFRCGTGGTPGADGRGNGQAGVVSTHIVHALTSLVALDAAPNNGDILKPCLNFYLPEDPLDASAVVASLRYEILTANYRYRCHGCFATAIKITGGNAGELPSIQVTWTVSRWEYTVATGAFPSAVTSTRNQPAPTGAGTMFLQPVGTSTRAPLRNPRSFSIDITLGVAPLLGINGVSQYQTIVGAVRVPSQIKVSWTEDSGAAADSPELDGFFMGTTPYHLLIVWSPVDGKSVSFYLPNICYTGPRPTQKNVNRVNRMSIEAMAYTGPDATSQLSASAMRMGWS